MLEGLLGSKSAELIFFYLYIYEEGYARGIAETFEKAVNPIKNQLIKFEKAGILVSMNVGRTNVFKWNPRYPFLKELQLLIKKAYEYVPETQKEKFYRKRTRPRRTGKPL